MLKDQFSGGADLRHTSECTPDFLRGLPSLMLPTSEEWRGHPGMVESPH